MKIYMNIFILCLETALLVDAVRGASLREEFTLDGDGILESNEKVNSASTLHSLELPEQEAESSNERRVFGILPTDKSPRRRHRPINTSKSSLTRNPSQSFSKRIWEERGSILKFRNKNPNLSSPQLYYAPENDYDLIDLKKDGSKHGIVPSEKLNVFTPASNANGHDSEMTQLWDHLMKTSPSTETNETEQMKIRAKIESFSVPPFFSLLVDRNRESVAESSSGNGEIGDDSNETRDQATLIETSEEEKLDVDEDAGNKTARFLDLFSRTNDTSECTTPKGENGHCQSMVDCPLRDVVNNYSLFLQQLCLLNRIFVGICCPDNPVVEILDDNDNSTKNVTEIQQPAEGCGISHNTRIVGGTMSLPHQWTWMVALLRRNRFYCGGVIINDWYILTAAHCVLGIKVRDLKIRLGEYNFLEKNEHQQDIPVAEIKRHALFVTLTFQHDIALLKLKRRIEYSKFIGSICLPDPKRLQDYTDVSATVVGWGTISFGGAASPVLRQVTIPVWDNENCDRSYLLENINESFLCAGAPENGEDACQGDSGGPLMALNAEDRWEVIGIVSWGRRCGDPRYPGVYTRVTSYLDWIAENSQ